MKTVINDKLQARYLLELQRVEWARKTAHLPPSTPKLGTLRYFRLYIALAENRGLNVIRSLTSNFRTWQVIHTSTRTGLSSREVSIRTLWSCFLEIRLRPCPLTRRKAMGGAVRVRKTS